MHSPRAEIVPWDDGSGTALQLQPWQRRDCRDNPSWWVGVSPGFWGSLSWGLPSKDAASVLGLP